LPYFTAILTAIRIPIRHPQQWESIQSKKPAIFQSRININRIAPRGLRVLGTASISD